MISIVLLEPPGCRLLSTSLRCIADIHSGLLRAPRLDRFYSGFVLRRAFETTSKKFSTDSKHWKIFNNKEIQKQIFDYINNEM